MARRRLTLRQQERIRAIQEQRRRQLVKPEPALAPSDHEISCHEGRVIARYGQNLAVADIYRKLHLCLSRQSIGEPVCGDRVVWQPTVKDQGVVTALLERSSVLSRPIYGGLEKPLAANIDLLVVVLAPEPVASQYLLDQYLIAAENMGLEALITLNKSDLMDDPSSTAFERTFGHYPTIGYPLIRASAKLEHGLDLLIDRLSGKTSILVGQSGVGKSSLIKALLPNIEIQVGRLSVTAGVGRHTTSAATLYDLPYGGAIIDSPGVRSFRLGHIGIRQLENGYREFLPFLGNCRFSDCRHEHEPDCALIDAVQQGRLHPQRLDNFRHMAARLQTGY